MPKRRRFALAVLLVALVATFFLPPVYWRVVGWVNGEAFYQCRPTSWWAREISASYSPTWLRISSGRWYPPQWAHEEVPISNLILPAELHHEVRVEIDPFLLNGDPRSLQVLMELLHRTDPKVRLLALCGLAELKRLAKCALPAIREACDDADEDVRSAAQWAAGVIEDELRKLKE